MLWTIKGAAGGWCWGSRPEVIEELAVHLEAYARELQRHVADLDDGFAIGNEDGVGNGAGFGREVEFAHRDFVAERAGARDDLAATFQLAGDSWDRIGAPGSLGRDEAHAPKEDPQCLGAALVHQRAGHHLIIDKVANQVPGVGFDLEFGVDLAQAVFAATGIDVRDGVDECEQACGQAWRGAQSQCTQRRMQG